MEKLNEKINSKGIKKNWIAEKVGISQPLLSMYLAGKRNMPKHIEISINNLIK